MGALPSFRETIADLIDLHYADMAELDRVFGRSKDATLRRIRHAIGNRRISHLTRDFVVQFANRRAKEGAGPVTIGVDISFLGTVLESLARLFAGFHEGDEIGIGWIGFFWMQNGAAAPTARIRAKARYPIRQIMPDSFPSA